VRASFNRIVGHCVERLAALSDGIFAVAMTLLVLDLHGPAKEAIHGEFDLLRALAVMSPPLIAYLMSFLTLGIFWNGQQAQLNQLARGDRSLSWIHLGRLSFFLSGPNHKGSPVGTSVSYQIDFVNAHLPQGRLPASCVSALQV